MNRLSIQEWITIPSNSLQLHELHAVMTLLNPKQSMSNRKGLVSLSGEPKTSKFVDLNRFGQWSDNLGTRTPTNTTTFVLTKFSREPESIELRCNFTAISSPWSEFHQDEGFKRQYTYKSHIYNSLCRNTVCFVAISIPPNQSSNQRLQIMDKPHCRICNKQIRLIYNKQRATG
jgi:hypothetical protein